MPFTQLVEWMAYAQLDPFGERRADLRIARLMAFQANMWRGKNQRAYRVEEFMPKFGEPKRQKSNTEIYQLLRTAVILGGKNNN